MKDVGTYLCGFIVDNIESQGKLVWLVQERLITTTPTQTIAWNIRILHCSCLYKWLSIRHIYHRNYGLMSFVRDLRMNVLGQKGPKLKNSPLNQNKILIMYARDQNKLQQTTKEESFSTKE
ncbi:hypothetical protein QL285_014264 [Trifolium repens]|nr:hypothetical protein QL285_014264 [Trifolium repens]